MAIWKSRGRNIRYLARPPPSRVRLSVSIGFPPPARRSIAKLPRHGACLPALSTCSLSTCSIPRLRQPTASLILVSFHAGPSALTLSKMDARRSFFDLPVSLIPYLAMPETEKKPPARSPAAAE